MFRNKANEVRLIWLVILLVAPFLLIAFLLRFIPIRILIFIYTRQGLSPSYANDLAQSLLMQDTVWSSLIGIIQGLMWYPIIYSLIKWVERRECSLSVFGFHQSSKKIWLVPIGLIAGIMLYLCYMFTEGLLTNKTIDLTFSQIGLLSAFLLTLNFFTNGFGEESAFRAYLQERIIQRHGLWVGIVIASSVFILLHLIIYRIEIIELMAGIILAAIFGILYVWSESVFLVGTMHAIFNLIQTLSLQWPSDQSLLIVNLLVLTIILIAFLIVRRKEKLGNKTAVSS
jgi:membrane protease YdiL (CAAX protease family)